MDKNTNNVIMLAIESSCDETVQLSLKTGAKYCQMRYIPKSICIRFMAESCRKLHHASISKR